MLSYKEQIRDRVAELLRDTGALNTAAGLGFTDADPKRVEGSLGDVRSNADWSYFDLRGVSEETTRAQLHVALEKAKQKSVVIAVDRTSVARSIHLLVRAVVDKMQAIDLGDRKPVARPGEASFVVIVDGASRFEQLDPELQKIPYWDFIR